MPVQGPVAVSRWPTTIISPPISGVVQGALTTGTSHTSRLSRKSLFPDSFFFFKKKNAQRLVYLTPKDHPRDQRTSTLYPRGSCVPALQRTFWGGVAMVAFLRCNYLGKESPRWVDTWMIRPLLQKNSANTGLFFKTIYHHIYCSMFMCDVARMSSYIDSDDQASIAKELCQHRALFKVSKRYSTITITREHIGWSHIALLQKCRALLRNCRDPLRKGRALMNETIAITREHSSIMASSGQTMTALQNSCRHVWCLTNMSFLPLSSSRFVFLSVSLSKTRALRNSPSRAGPCDMSRVTWDIWASIRIWANIRHNI